MLTYVNGLLDTDKHNRYYQPQKIRKHWLIHLKQIWDNVFADKEKTRGRSRKLRSGYFAMQNSPSLWDL